MLSDMKPWCKKVNSKMFTLGIKMGQLAEKVGMSREYTSSVVHGRHYSPNAMKRISDALNIPFEPHRYLVK